MAPTDLLYSSEHEWVRVEKSSVTVGITDHAQEALSDVVFVELPEVGREVAKGEEVAVLESTKAAAGVYAPAAGKVTEVNEALADDPGAVNRQCYGAGWMFKLAVSDESDLSDMMEAATYEKFLSEQD
ncbi:MAG: glycine cleavage system protein GcvH [Planctomycetes bacterium]|nr:glycine cleavage system protein GcvH [Planctomycetota bacterium]